MIYTNVDDAKLHLKIESDYVDDDIYIASLLDVAELSVMNYINDVPETYITSGTTEYNVPLAIVQATYFLMSNFYVNRTMVSFAQGVEIPYTFQFLLNPYKNYTIK